MMAALMVVLMVVLMAEMLEIQQDTTMAVHWVASMVAKTAARLVV